MSRYADSEYRIDIQAGSAGWRPWAHMSTVDNARATELCLWAQKAGASLGMKYRLTARTTTRIEWTPIKSVTVIVRRAPVETVIL